MTFADVQCAPNAEPVCEPQSRPADAPLCGHTPEQFAEAALALEPRGLAWCRQFTTVKAALYRAFGRLLSDFERRMCDLFDESLACGSVELLDEWEKEYGLPGACSARDYPSDLAGRQAMVCAARRGEGVTTLPQLQEVLQIALECPTLTLENFVTHNWVTHGATQTLMVQGGVCVRGIGPNFSPPPEDGELPDCPYIYHSTVGGWTGGVGIPLTTADPIKWQLLICLMDKHLPAHIAWAICD